MRNTRSVEDERALFVGDILTAGLYGASLASFRPGDTVAVVGAGPVGYLVARALTLRGAGRVVVLDRLPDRLALVERIGATPIDVGAVEPRSRVRNLTGGRGVDASVEAVGSLAGFETAVAVTRRGGSVVLLGVFADETIALELGRYWSRGLTVAFSGICPVQAHWGEAMQAVTSGRIDPTPNISHLLALEEAPLGYGIFDRREAIKVLLRP